MEPRSGTERLHVLVADGDPDMRFYLRSCLRRLHTPPLRLTEAEDDATARRVLLGDPVVELMIAQAEGRGADGRGFERTLALAGESATAVVLVSDAAAVGRWEADRGQSPVRGATLVGKPFNSAQLVEAVAAALERAGRGGRIAG